MRSDAEHVYHREDTHHNCRSTDPYAKAGMFKHWHRLDALDCLQTRCCSARFMDHQAYLVSLSWINSCCYASCIGKQVGEVVIQYWHNDDLHRTLAGEVETEREKRDNDG